MSLIVSNSQPFYAVALLNADGEAMDYVNVTVGAAVTDSFVHQALAGFIGLDHQEEGYTPGPCVALRIERIEETMTLVPAPEPPAEPAA